MNGRKKKMKSSPLPPPPAHRRPNGGRVRGWERSPSGGGQPPLRLTSEEAAQVNQALCFWSSSSPVAMVVFDTVSKIVVPRKKKKNDGSMVLHTPLSMLNQLMPGLVYKIEQVSGPSHGPQYDISVEINEEKYCGSGIGKQQAKQKTAEVVLNKLFPDVMAQYSVGPNQNLPLALSPSSEFPGGPITPELASFSPKRQQKLMKKADEALAGKVNPLAVLNEILHGVKFNCLSENSGPFAKFAYGFTVGGAVYKGTGNSKKAAKCAAARAYLSYKFSGDSAMMTPPSPGVEELNNRSTFHLLSPSAADVIANLVLTKYDELLKDFGEYSRRKVIAGLVVTKTADLSDPEVVSLATGTKTISGEHISVSGSVLNDSHAEVITRRGFVSYLYKELEKLANKDTAGSSIFQPNSNNKGYHLKPDVNFHLYINSAPCGDGRIFSPHEVSEANMTDRHPNRQSRGQLRTKIESGEGTIPVKPKEIQTWDGVIQGQRLLTMSCSDKVLKWNVLGLQGTLLSHFIAPVYLHSVVISSLFNQPHLYRALCGRIENSLGPLPPSFRLNKHLVNKTSSPEARVPCKAPNHSVNWVIGEDNVEVVNAMTGRTIAGTSSRLCKRMLLEKFMNILKLNLSTISGITRKNTPYSSLYADLKNSAESYGQAKAELFATFPRAMLGTWVKKPFEQDQFELNSA